MTLEIQWSCVPILCAQLLWINQKATQLPLIKSSSMQQTQLEANCNIPVSLTEIKKLWPASKCKLECNVPDLNSCMYPTSPEAPSHATCQSP